MSPWDASDLLSLSGVTPMVLSSIALLAIFLGASFAASFHDEQRRRASAGIQEGAHLPTGFCALHGIARSFDPRVAGDLVTSVRTEMLHSRRGDETWTPHEQSVIGERFVFVHDSGEEIEIDARAFSLEGFPETASDTYHPPGFNLPRRKLISKLSSGDEVWVTGVLARPKDRRGGAYRGGGARRKLRAPKRGAVGLFATPPLLRWKALGRAHKIGAFTAASALAALHLICFRTVDIALFSSPVGASVKPKIHDIYQILFVPGVAAVIAVAVIYSRQLNRARSGTGA